MGFSLEHFFKELIFVLEESNVTQEQILEYVKEQQKYAKECGQLG